jgi:uncharacterized protein (TIGR03118 family)
MSMMSRRSWSLLKPVLLAGYGLSLGSLAQAQHYEQTNLVSDLPIPPPGVQDTHLVNPWGMSRSSGSFWWVADNGTGVSTLYSGSGAPQALVVTIPPAATSTEGGVPTGTVFNGTADFELPTGGPAKFIFVGEDGTISGWNGGTAAVVVSTKDKSVYKGVAIARFKGANYLYVANFSKKRIDVFDTHFKRVHLDDDAFEDEHLPRSFAPFNVQNIGDSLYVAFAKLDTATNDEVAGAGLGYVDAFSPGGRLQRRLEHGDWLNAPWGLVLASGDFGAFSHHLLVGQFGSGEVAAYNVSTGRFVGKMRKPNDDVLSIPGLWALSFGNGANAGPATTLFFTAGIEDEAHGLFGTLLPIAAEKLLGNGQ